MALANKDRVLRLAGNPNPTRELPKLDIDAILEDADGQIYEITRTSESYWVPGVTFGFKLAKTAAEKWAAAELLNEWNDPNKKAAEYMKDYENAIAKLKKTGYGEMNSDNPAFNTGQSTYKSIGNNAQVGRYYSRNAFGGIYD